MPTTLQIEEGSHDDNVAPPLAPVAREEDEEGSAPLSPSNDELPDESNVEMEKELEKVCGFIITVGTGGKCNRNTTETPLTLSLLCEFSNHCRKDKSSTHYSAQEDQKMVGPACHRV